MRQAIKPAVLILAIFVSLTSGAATQAVRAPTRAEQETLYNEMVKSIRDAIRKSAAPMGHSTLNKKVRIRLFSCGLAYSLMAKRAEISSNEREWYLMGADLYPRAAFALKDAEGSLSSEIKQGSADFEKTWKSERAMFLFLRACQDFSNPDGAYSAILDITLE